MACEEIKNIFPPLSEGFLPPSLNSAPSVPQAKIPSSYFVCEGPGEFPLLAKAATGPALQKSAALFAPWVALSPIKTTLPPPPSSEWARLLYDLTTQLQDFELTTTLKMPVEGISDYGPVKTFSRAVIKDQGALVELGTEFKPALGPQAIVKYLNQVPIIGPFFSVRVLKVEMDPSTRRLKARVKYLFFPMTQEVHDDYLKKAELPPHLIRGPNHDLTKGLPVYSWQILDLLFKIIEEKGKQVAVNVGLDGVKPRLDQSEITLEGNFSNKKVSLRGLDLHFAPLGPQEKHRVTLKGNLLNPVLVIRGLQAAELQGSGGRIKISNAEGPFDPLEIRIKIDPLGEKSARFEVSRYQSKKVLIESTPQNPAHSPLKLEMEEGADLEELVFQNETDGPRLELNKLTVKKIGLEVGGVRLSTTPGDRALFESLRVKMVGGQPEFFSKLKGSASGELEVVDRGRRLGFLKFKALEGEGTLKVGQDSFKKFRVALEGSLSAELSELQFLVQSDKIKASVATQIEGASIAGLGRLTVWPDETRAMMESPDEKKAFTVRGRGGKVVFHQDPSEVAAWPELKKNLGNLDAKKVVTDLIVKPSEMEFSVQKMSLKAVALPDGGSPTLEIQEADLSGIQIRGEVWGRLFTRLPGGLYFPIFIPEDARLQGALMKVGRLQDKGGDTDRRSVLFNQVELEGEESKPTFSNKDQKRCGIDRQHIHARLGLFQFTEDRQFKIEQVDPHFHVYLKNHVGGGCLKIE